MSIWILHQNLSPEEEDHILERTHLTLPFEGLPDLSMLNNKWECQHLLRALHTDEPPETIALRLDRIWQQFTGVQIEDLIVVPLPSTKKLAIATVSGAYQYQVSPQGEDVHLIPVTWYQTLHPYSALGKEQAILTKSSQPLFELQDKGASAAIRELLPHSYNRFVRWKWVWIIIFILAEVRLMMRLMEH